MTRFASIMGVAAVATLVLLSGCETAMETDYAKDLAGTWKVTLNDRELPNPSIPGTAVPGMSEVTAVVTRTATNMGTVSLTIVDTPAGATAGNTIEVAGEIEVTATKIMVSDVDMKPPEAAAAIPGGVAALKIELTYELSDDGSELTVADETLFPVLLGTMEIKLTKDD